jgi:DNA-binding transcriptional MerR regulator
MITPKQASKTLTIPSSTLRRWCKEFEDHLTPHEPGKHRTFDASDLDVLRKIRELLNEGLNYQDIHKRLNAIEKPSSEEMSLLILEDFTKALENNRASIQALNERVSELEAWITTPAIKRIFRKPPIKRKE